MICGHGGIGRRVRLRGVWATIRVQVPVTAPRQTEFEPQIRICKRGCGLCRKKVKVKRQ